MPASISPPVSHERWRLVSLWLGLLAGPSVWLMLLEFNYVGAYVACETRSTWFMHAATALSVVLVVAAGFFAWRARHGGTLEVRDEAAPPLSDITRLHRSQWMSVAGVCCCAFFVLVILAMEIPILILRECQ